MTLKEHLQSKFVYVDEVAEILEIGRSTKKNVFLYGRGGHAKSEILHEFLTFVDPTGENSFVQACGEGLTEEKLFGGMDLKKFQQSGEIEYLIEKSFMNKRFVVFEELLDSRMNVLLSLKDILTSGMFRQGSQQFKIKTEFIVCLTNRTKQEVSEDNSVKALMERFPLEQKVEWEKYEEGNYIHMFQKVLKKDFSNIASLCAKINESGDFVSPRTAIHMAQVYEKTSNMGNMKYFGATTDIMEAIQKVEKNKMDKSFLISRTSDFNTLKEYTVDTVPKAKAVLSKLTSLESALESRSYGDEVYSSFISIRDKVKAYRSSVKETLVNLVILNE